jgi:pimeloyl-ACP methyl ester carboxylesterase
MAGTRSRTMAALFVAGLVLGAVLLAIDDRMWDEGGPAIVGFELAGSSENADEILREWGSDGRSAARLSLWLDFLYLAGYASFWALAVRAAGDLAARRGWKRLGQGRRLWPLALAAGAFDVLENVFLLVVVGGSTGVAPVAAVFAILKFLALAVVLGYVGVVLVRRFPVVAGGLAALGMVVLLVNTYVTSRITKDARPDIGQVVRVEGGDVQVAVQGPRGAPEVVLVHGFSASMRWWDAVAPELAEKLRVVRIDLLGHGGSEKPRDGYTMEEQADLVAQVIRELRLRRPAVVGHSMGGIVGTALVERHPELVSRLMMIGTAPDDEDEGLGLIARAAFWPVVGQATDWLIDERWVRWVVEQGFAPEFDPPEYLVRDIYGRTTWSSFKGSADGLRDFWRERPLHERLRGRGVPVSVLLGGEEKHAARSERLYHSIGARVVVLDGLDHTPQVEDPVIAEALIERFVRGR